MKIATKLFAVLFTASFLFSCQEEEVKPASTYDKETKAAPSTGQTAPTDFAVKENVVRPEEVKF